MMLEMEAKTLDSHQSPHEEWRVTNWVGLTQCIDQFLELFDHLPSQRSAARDYDVELLGKLQELREFKW